MTMTWKQTQQTGVIQLALQETVLPQPDLGSGLLLSLAGSGAICEGDPLPTSSPLGCSSHPAPHCRPGFREGLTTHHSLQDIVSTGGSQGGGGPAEPSSPSPTPPRPRPAPPSRKQEFPMQPWEPAVRAETGTPGILNSPETTPHVRGSLGLVGGGEKGNRPSLSCEQGSGTRLILPSAWGWGVAVPSATSGPGGFGQIPGGRRRCGCTGCLAGG